MSIITKTDISKLVDYLLLNAYSVNSSGLYNGKAGISLCLFEIARFLQDDYIENHAFELLQQSLLTRSEDIGFENGLSGVGYVLTYLIKNKFIDADFDELFGLQLKKIEKYIEKSDISEIGGEKFIRQNIKIVFFLDLLCSCDSNYHYLARLFPIFSKAVSRLLNKYTSAIDKRQNVALKTEYITFFETYLTATAICDEFLISSEALDGYTLLFKRNRLISNFKIGYYLGNIITRDDASMLKKMEEVNKGYALQNIHLKMMPLAQYIDLLYLLRKNENLYKEYIELLEKGLFDDMSGEQLEQNLLSAIGKECFVAGYQSGIARFLLYLIYREIKDVRTRLVFL